MQLDLQLSPVAPAAAATTVTGPAAPTATVAAPVRPAETPSMGASLASMTASLAIVLALVFAFAWLMRRVQGLRPSRAGELRVEGGLQLGPKERVLVLRAGDSRLLLGVTPSQISLLHCLPDAAPAPAPAAESADPAATPSFAGALAEQLRRRFERT